MSADHEPCSTLEDLNAHNKLACQLYKQLAKSDPNSNIVFSPPSILLNLYEVYLGSEGKTKEELEKLLNLDPSRLQNIIKDIQHILEHGHPLKKKQDRHYDLYGSSKVLVGDDIGSVKHGYTEALRKATGENVIEKIDRNDVNKAVNSLTAALTGNRISGSLNEHVDRHVEKAAREKNSLLLLSTVHFYADWENKFLQKSSNSYEGRNRQAIKELTSTVENFHNADGNITKVVMVHLQEQIFLTRDENLGVTIAELPLSHYSMNLTIVLPDDATPSGMRKFEEKFNHETLEILRKNWQMPKTHVYLPKFALESHLTLGKTLQNLGLSSMFSSNADLSSIGGSHLHVADVVHVAGIEISAETADPLPPYKPKACECSVMVPDSFASGFHVNHPFFFFVTARHPQVWCVIGKVLNIPQADNFNVWSHHKHPKEDEE